MSCRIERRRAAPNRGGLAPLSILLICCGLAAGCGSEGTDSEKTGADDPARTGHQAVDSTSVFLDMLEHRTFRFFWDQADPVTGLIPDRYPTESFASLAATGFGLTAYPIGVARGFITRDEGRERVLRTLRFLWEAPQDTSRGGSIGYRGFYYHFVHPGTGLRFERVELSTVDTALLMAGALFCASWFDGSDPAEAAIREYADSLYRRVDWQWAQVRPPTIGHGWNPENGHLPYDWRGYNEAMILYLLALASPTYPVSTDAWEAWTSGYRWGEFQGQEYLGFAPLFGHQYTHCWIDFRGIQDEVMRKRESDYFENSRRAVLAQYAYAQENPMDWAGYGPRFWGLTACDGPLHVKLEIRGRERQFHTYWARGACFTEVNDDGTVCPSAAGGSLPFAPELVIPTLMSMRETFGSDLFGEYGFLDACNPTFRAPVEVQHGRVDPERGWFDTDYLGIDQGPILIMIANYKDGIVWNTMRGNPHIIRGLKAAGFQGGWLDEAEDGE